MPFFTPSARAGAARKAATHMIFRVGEQLYGIPLDMVSEVVSAQRLSPIRSDDAAVCWEMELRGGAIIVIDMGMRLQGARLARGDNNCVLVIGERGARSGCLTGAPEELASIPEDEIIHSGCLVEEAKFAARIPECYIKTPENSGGGGYGYPLCTMGGEIVLLPSREAFYPR